MSKTIYGRVGLKTGVESFHRCGIKFTRAWQKLEVDAATAKRLDEEQMLEVVSDEPADYAEPDAAGATATGNATPVVPTSATERLAAITAAIAKLDKDDAALFTTAGVPAVPAISAVLGWNVSAAERTQAWDELNKASA